jgi:hypothetical protein
MRVFRSLERERMPIFIRLMIYNMLLGKVGPIAYLEQLGNTTTTLAASELVILKWKI